MTVVTTERISARMRSVRRKNTSCELKLAVVLRASGQRFTQHSQLMGCWPDFVFADERVTVFVDGDFWHGRLLCEHGEKALHRSFKTNQEFWVKKISRNAQRDLLQNARLRRAGWSVLRLWERDVIQDVTQSLEKVERRLASRRRQLRLRHRGASLSLSQSHDRVSRAPRSRFAEPNEAR
jgi:DNA mismatch endonuclease (patch repair protein)